MKHLALILAALALCACESLPPLPETPSGLSLQGRIKITLPNQVVSSNLRWTQTETGFDAYLWGALGAVTTRIYGNSETLSIEARGTKASGAPEEILQEHLGWSLPIELLLSWIAGNPSESSEVQALKRNEQGLIESFRQAGWLLEYSNLDGQGRYTRLLAERRDVSVLVVVKRRADSQKSL